MRDPGPRSTRRPPHSGERSVSRPLAPGAEAGPLTKGPGGSAIETLFLDEFLIVVLKPAGLHTQPPASRKETSLLDLLSRVHGPSVRIVHRLDYDASGLVVFALDRRAAGPLGAAFERHDVKRDYRALIPIPLEPGTAGIIDAPLRAVGGRTTVDPSGDPAVTHFRARRNGTFLGIAACELEISLETGRMHQIRVHLQHRLSPILGDTKYGGRPFPRLALHAFRLSFEHPMTGAALSFERAPEWPGDPGETHA